MKIGITPRFEKSIHGSVWYVFEQELIDYVKASNSNIEINLLFPEATKLDFDLLIIAGGANPGDNLERDKFEIELINHAREHALKIIGICRGAQLLAVLSGASLIKLNDHVNSHREVKLSNEVKTLNAGKCFHNFGIEDLGVDWEVLARDSYDDSIELFRNKIRSELGVLSHPERSTKGINLQDLIQAYLHD